MRHTLIRLEVATATTAFLAGAVPCWADEDNLTLTPARRAAVVALWRQQRLTDEISELSAQYKQSGDVRIAIRLQELAVSFARDCPTTPLGRFLRVGPAPGANARPGALAGSLHSAVTRGSETAAVPC